MQMQVRKINQVEIARNCKVHLVIRENASSNIERNVEAGEKKSLSTRQ